MTNIKTAISLQESLFEQVERLAQEMEVSRSRLFVMAIEDFIRDHQDRQLFEAINQASAALADDPVEQTRLRQIRRQHRRMVEGEWQSTRETSSGSSWMSQEGPSPATVIPMSSSEQHV